ncbi:MAG: PH domain-containing protein, partial [Gemmatimonadota bacterium]|nr:PH domain-containing protein [Gemmatimonadota bacterium]
MNYIDNNLVPGERVMYRAHLHWKIFLPFALFVVLSIVLATLGGITRNMNSPQGATWLFYAAGAALAAAVIAFLVELFKYKSSEFAVTDKRVIIKTGMFNRHTMETLLTKVENISVEQGVGGRMFNYGTIRVTGTGGTTEPFADIANPL